MSYGRRLSALTLLFLMAHVVSGCAQYAAKGDEDLRGEIDALKEGQESLREELVEIRKLLQKGQPAPARQAVNVSGMSFDIGENPVKGSENATVVLLEFTDYQCPYCRRHTLQTHPSIESVYIDTGKIRYVSLDMPIASLHPLAFKAAEASHCAEDQGKFWQMRERLFASQKALVPWNAHADALGLDVALFDVCLNSGKHRDAVRRDRAEAKKAGATGTPSFVVALIDDDSGVIRGFQFIRGARPYSAFKRALDAAAAAHAQAK